MQKLVFTHAGNFRSKYGEQALADLRSRLQALRQADAARGLTTEILYVDEVAAKQGGSVPQTPAEIKQVVDDGARQTRFDFFLIVGGDDIVPFFRYPNPVSEGSQGDSAVPSDNYYARGPEVTETSPYFVQRSLGRLANGHDADPDVLWRQLDEILSFQPAPADQAPGVGISAEYWSTPSAHIASDLHIAPTDFHLSRPIDLDANPSHLNPGDIAGRLLQFFNVHGSPRTADWYGQSGDQFPRAYGPPWVPAGVRHCVVGSEACYGADIVGTKVFPRPTSQAVCLTYLAQQAAGFCGSTTIAYGATNDSPTLTAADLLVKYFLETLRQGKSLGDALLHAKSRLTTEVVHSRGSVDPITGKTLLQFVLYGDPSVTPLVPPSAAAKTLHIDTLMALTGAGELGRRLFDMLPEAQLVERPAQKGRLAEGMPGPKNASGMEYRLLGRQSYELKWPEGRRESAARELSAKLPFLEVGFRPARRSVIWHVDTYLASRANEALDHLLVQLIEDVEGRQELLMQAASH